MNEIIKLLDLNPYSRCGEKKNKIEYIIVHWVGNANTSAMANRNYFNNLPSINAERRKKGLPDIYASSNLIVGLQGELVRCIPDDEVAFHSGSWSMNRKSIGIEVCHPDWGGKFSDMTYKSLVELTAELCKKYGIGINNVIRHHDVTGKDCPKYYVENPKEWNKFKQDVQNLINGTITPIPKEEEGMEEKPMLKFRNGKTPENIYADSLHTTKIGVLNKWEVCECFGIFNGAPMVRYRVGKTNNYKIGFASDIRCVWTK